MNTNKILITCASVLAVSALSIYTFGASTIIGGIGALLATTSLGTAFIAVAKDSGNSNYSRAVSNSISRIKSEASKEPLDINISNKFGLKSKKDNTKKSKSFRKPTSSCLKF